MKFSIIAILLLAVSCSSRSFKREWSLSDDIEVKDVTFADGLLIAKLGKIVPEHHARKDYL